MSVKLLGLIRILNLNGEVWLRPGWVREFSL